jgi:DUF4097 and DUF4098 domain-containing protein YvlB
MKRLAFLFLSGILVTALAVAGGSREDGDFSYSGITTLEIEGATFDVEIDAIRGRAVSMSIERYPDNFTVYHSVTGDTVRVWVESRFSLFRSSHDGLLVFTVPADTEIRVDNSTGDIDARDLSSDRLSFETTTGEISLRGITGNLEIDTTTGEVTLEDYRGRLDVQTTTGDVEVSDSEGPMSIRTTTGRQELTNVRGDLTLRSTTGRIRLEDVEGQLEIRTTTGSQEGDGVMLTADSTFEASTGSIEIDLENDIAALEFDLESTTGSLRVGNEDSQRQLFLGSTGIRVEGRTSTGSQVYR